MDSIIEQSVSLDNSVAIQRLIDRLDDGIRYKEPAPQTIDKVAKLLQGELTFTSKFLDSDMSASGGFSGATGQVSKNTSNVVYDYSVSALVTQEYKDGEKINEYVRELSENVLPQNNVLALNNVSGTMTTVVLRYAVGFRLVVQIEGASADASVSMATFSAKATAREIQANSSCVVYGYQGGPRFGLDLPGFIFLKTNDFTAETLGAMATWGISFQEAHNEFFSTKGSRFLPKVTHVSINTNKKQEVLNVTDQALLDAFVWRRFTFSDTLAHTEEIRVKGKKDEVRKNSEILTRDAVQKRYIQIMNEFGVENVKSDTAVPKRLKEYADGLFRWFNHNQI